MFKVEYELWDVNKQQSLLVQLFIVLVGDLCGVVYQIVDQIYEKIIGVCGVFWICIVYIMVVGLGNNIIYLLIVVDLDGYNLQVVVCLCEFLLLLVWLLDGCKIVYVFFESGNFNVYV